MNTALIQLVSEQTLPNVFPALALAPAQTVLLHTPQTQRQSAWITRALQLAGHAAAPRFVELPDHPDHHATGRAVLEQLAAARDAGLTPVVNITGGTKLMSIGAFAAAHQQKAAACYVDTTQRQIHAATTTPLPAPLDSSPVTFRRIAGQLTVAILTAAHGIKTPVTGRDPAPWLPAARLLAADPDLEQATHDFAVRCLDECRRKPNDYVKLLDTSLDELPDQLIEPLAEAGHIYLRGDRWFLWHPEADKFARWAGGERYDAIQDYFAATAPLQQIIAFLSGGWWELAVLEAAQASGRFRDLHWSPQATRPDGSTSIEEDILAVEDLSLALFSCKRSGDRARLLRAFEELDSAGRHLGGAFTRRYFAVALPGPGHAFAEIKARAADTQTTLLGPVSRLPRAFS